MKNTMALKLSLNPIQSYLPAVQAACHECGHVRILALAAAQLEEEVAAPSIETPILWD
jgi:hypothetical protein